MLGSTHVPQREIHLLGRLRRPAAATARACTSAPPGAINPHAPTVGANKTGLTPTPVPPSRLHWLCGGRIRPRPAVRECHHVTDTCSQVSSLHPYRHRRPHLAQPRN